MKLLRLTVYLIVVLSVGLLIAPLSAQGNDVSGTPDEICAAATPADEPETREFEAADDVLETGVDYYAIMCTEVGAVYINLFESVTPITVNNFVFLAENGFYNNITFHRVIANFMVQGGDPTGTGTGGPGYRFEDEFLGYIVFDRPGLLAMANAGPGTNGSQFFITTVVTSHLNGAHTIFGEVLSGQDIVESIPVRDPQTASEPGAMLETVVIITDPSTVDVDIEPTEQGEISEDVIRELISSFPELPGVASAEASGVYSPSDWAGILDEDIQDAAETFVEDYGLQFYVNSEHRNESCDLDTAPFESIGYKMLAFASSEDATAAAGDESLLDLISNGADVEADEDTDGLYTWEETACDVDGLHVIQIEQVGSIITVADSVYPVDSLFSASDWLQFVVKDQVYEVFFGSVLRQAINP